MNRNLRIALYPIRRFSLVGLLAVLLLFSCNWSAHAASKVEYKVVPMTAETPQLLEKVLNDLGKEGWELIELNTATGFAIFKRQG